MAYKKGDFSWTNKGEAVFVMTQYLKKLELSLSRGTAPFEDRQKINSEVEELINTITRRRNLRTFDLEGFLASKGRYNNKKDESYKNYVDERIAGTWVDPKKEEAAKEQKEDSKNED